MDWGSEPRDQDGVNRQNEMRNAAVAAGAGTGWEREPSRSAAGLLSPLLDGSEDALLTQSLHDSVHKRGL